MKKRVKTREIGKYGETIISSFPKAINILTRRYKIDFPNMLVFLYLNAFDTNCVIQKFKSYPLKRISYIEKYNSAIFQAKWESSGSLGYVLPKSFFEIESKKSGDEVEWSDISSFSPRTKEGRKIRKAVERDRNRPLCDSFLASSDIRIDNIGSINMYDWGFELIGDVISLLAVDGLSEIAEVGMVDTDISLDTTELSFNLDEVMQCNGILTRWSREGYEPDKSYNKDVDFDEILFGSKSISEKVSNNGDNNASAGMDDILLDDRYNMDDILLDD